MAVEESVDDGACMKQVLDGTQRRSRLNRKSVPRRSYSAIIGPLCWDHGLAAVGQNQHQIQAALTMDPTENLERSRFKGMVTADNRDPLRKVMMMGSVSWLTSIT